MTYIIIAAIIIFASSIRAISFAIWQFSNKNICGGILVSLIALAAMALITVQFFLKVL